MSYLEGVAHKIKVTRRDYYIKVKAALMEAIISLSALRYGEVNKENCYKPNSHVLLDIWDKFLKYYLGKHHTTKHRKLLFWALRRISVAEYEHDHMYQDWMDWWVEELVEAYLDNKWQPKSPLRPMRELGWEEPNDKRDLVSWVEFRRMRRQKTEEVKV